MGWRAVAIVSCLTLSVACGQFAGTHADRPRSLSSPNGENQGICAAATLPPGVSPPPSPPPGCTVVGYKEVVTITRVRTAGTLPGHPVQVRISGRLEADPFRICPVHGKGFYSDDFGAPRFSGGFHRHAGNDIFAALGTPIVAPFDGRAEPTPNSLGGLAVSVYGANGYAYNAHLSRYGTLGSVRAGTVIGFVGNTGDAAGGPYHDHFEWHPDPLPPAPLHVSPYGASVIGRAGDPAIDPFPFLQGVCR